MSGTNVTEVDAAAGANGIPFDTIPANTEMGVLTLSAVAGRVIDLGTAGVAGDSTATTVGDTSQVASGSVTVNFPNSPQNFLVDIESKGASATTLTRAATTAELAGGVDIDSENPAAPLGVIPINNPTATTTLTATAGTNLSFSPITRALGVVDQEGYTGQTFEWVGSGSNAQSVFRVTGGAPGDQYFVQLSNTQNGSDGVYDLTPTLPYSNGEVVFTSADLAAQAGEFVRANATVTVVRDGAAGSFPGTIRRFIAGANGTLTTFDGDFSQSCTITSDAVASNADTAANVAYATSSCTQ